MIIKPHKVLIGGLGFSFKRIPKPLERVIPMSCGPWMDLIKGFSWRRYPYQYIPFGHVILWHVFVCSISIFFYCTSYRREGYSQFTKSPANQKDQLMMKYKIEASLWHLEIMHMCNFQGDQLTSQDLTHLPKREISLVVYADEVCQHNAYLTYAISSQ